MKIRFALILLMFSPSAAFAQDEPIETDRPDQTETVATVPKGRFQSESGFTHRQAERNGRELILPETLWKYGVNDRLELRLITEFEFNKYGDSLAQGLEPIDIGLKVNLWKEQGIIPETSVIVTMKLPKVASKDLAVDYVAPEIRFLFQNMITDAIDLGYNLSADWDGTSPNPIFEYTLSPNFKLNDEFSAYAEAYGYLPQQQHATHWVDGGFKYLITKNIQIDISGGYELTSHNHFHSYYESLGFSFRI
ncbi:transporter [Flavobacterium zepuense]|uniref:Transporter n=1 Tax=Flavobacterium zepuense TaxID=2593302 RepID=A0A552V1C1_9FLAO|nr:transporter [Flavobacterium zepuense]TRW24273.1 transporter [Flavobacterium zepuense]